MREEKNRSRRVIQSVAGLVAVGGLAIAAGAQAAPPGPATAHAPVAAPLNPAALLVDCASTFDSAVSEFSRVGASQTYAIGGVMVNETTYGGVGIGGTFVPSSGRISGTIPVQLPPQPGLSGPTASGPVKTVPFELWKVDGKVHLKWTVDGTPHQAQISTCQSRIWTAASGNSAIMIHQGTPTTPPH